MIQLVVKNSRVGPVLGRHPWVFSGALTSIPDGIPAGTPVRLSTGDGRFLALGYFNSYSQIAVRIWGYDEQEKIDGEFFKKRIHRAYELRKRYVESESTDSYRIVNGESDLLPGLIVDRYADCLVLQCHTRGIERWKELIVDTLMEALRPRGIYERSESGSRKTEGAGESSGLLTGDVPDLVQIMENGFRFLVDVKKGQKTGFFLDQRDKRKALLAYSGNRSVLNCFSYTGGFSVYALAGGAGHVTNVDVSSSALDLARENIRLNSFPDSSSEFICQDAKSYLKTIQQDQFNLIVLDPPAFIKDRRKKKEGLVGYRTINELAVRALPPDSILLTCSCSAHLSPDEFRYLLSETGARTGRSLLFLETFGHGIDHPELVSFPEGRYLKCFIVRT